MAGRRAIALTCALMVVLAGCSGDDGGGDDGEITTFGQRGIPAPTTDEPLVGRWETDDPDGTCLTFSPSEPRVIEIRPGTDDRPYPTAIDLGGNVCVADGSVAFEPAGDEGEVTAYGGSIGSPQPFNGALSQVADRSFQLQIGDQTVRFDRVGPGPEEDESTLLGIPSPGEAVTPRNAGLAAGIMVLLLGLVSFPAMLLNSTLEANLDTITARLDRILRRPNRRDRAARPAKPGFWSRWRGMGAYLALSAALYGMMQPGWGLNGATAVTMVGFLAALLITTGAAVVVTMRFLDRRGRGQGRPQVLTLTAPLALLGVVASRLAGFVPGFAYGLIAGYEPNEELDEQEDRALTVKISILTLVLGLVAWFALGPLRALPDAIETIPVAAAGGVFTVAVEALLIGLIPLRFLPGHAVRARSRVGWAALWLSGAFLFALVLLRPGLATAQDGSTVWMLATSGAFAVAAIATWWFFARRAPKAPPTPTPTIDPEPGPDPEPPDPTHGSPF